MSKLSRNSLENLERRLAHWKDLTGPAWLVEQAPRIIAELEAEIAARKDPRRLVEDGRDGGTGV